MQVEIRHINAFLAVANLLHFGKAATQLNIAQPALSRTIQGLENIVGTSLLERNTRSVKLTAAGLVFRDNCVRIIQELAETIQATQRIGLGHLCPLAVGYVDFALHSAMPILVRRFRRANPDLILELNQQTPDVILRLLSERRIDCGFLLGPVIDKQLDTHCIRSDPPIVVMPVSHRFALKSRITLNDLFGERFVMFAEKGWSLQREEIQRACVQAGFVPQTVLEIHNVETMLAFIAAEFGVGICPENAQLYQRNGIVTRPLIGTKLTFDLFCAWNKDNTERTPTEFVAYVGAYSAGKQNENRANHRTFPSAGNM